MNLEQSSDSQTLKIYHDQSYPISPSSPNQQFLWMDQYFYQNVLQEQISIQHEVSPFIQEQSTLLSHSQPPQSETLSIEPSPNKNKSVFHNFQKHLITLLKRIIPIKKGELSQLPFGNRAYDLWRIFLRLGSKGKKSLYIIFGVAQQENEENIRSSTLEIPQLGRMLNKHGIEEIEKAQQLLRKVVSQQAAHIPREMIQCECKMQRFEEFYYYFRSFIEEIKEGPISRRMVKQRKLKLASMLQGK